jgi:hypothetical protein
LTKAERNKPANDANHADADRCRTTFVRCDQFGQSTPTSTSTPTPTATPIVFSPQTLADLRRLQQAALSSDYAYKQVAHLANNIGPRLSGSAQAAKSVEYVANELKAIGCEVQLEKVIVPHWVRGEETAALVQFPGQAENTTQKIVLCALGASVATASGRDHGRSDRRQKF